jgi:hypothetical protein
MLGETITRLHATRTTTDRYGNTVPDWTTRLDREPVAGCLVAPDTSPEDLEQGRRGVVLGLTVYTPADVDPGAHDRFEIHGDTWEVDGEPAPWRYPGSGRSAGHQIHLRRVEG